MGRGHMVHPLRTTLTTTHVCVCVILSLWTFSYLVLGLLISASLQQELRNYDVTVAQGIHESSVAIHLYIVGERHKP